MARATDRVSHRGGQPAGRPVPIDRSALVRRLADRPAFLCLDFDGMLVPIAPHPDQATLDDAGRTLLRALAQVLPVASVSGRARATLRALWGFPRSTTWATTDWRSPDPVSGAMPRSPPGGGGIWTRS